MTPDEQAQEAEVQDEKGLRIKELEAEVRKLELRLERANDVADEYRSKCEEMAEIHRRIVEKIQEHEIEALKKEGHSGP